MYLKESERAELNKSENIDSPEKLAFVLFNVVKSYLNNTSGRGYSSFIEVAGALDEVKNEVRRRIGEELLNGMKQKNGDI